VSGRKGVGRGCQGRDCGSWTCPSCRTKVLWQRGVYRKDLDHRWWDWTEAEKRRLRQLAGTTTPEAIARTLTAEFVVPRTVDAVKRRAELLGISLYQEGIPLRDLGGVFGTSQAQIKRRWIGEGLLCVRCTAPGRRGNKWLFDQAEVERFIREHPWAYDAEHMRDGHPLTRLARVVQRAEPWVTLDVAARYIGLSPGYLTIWARRGLLPYRRRWHHANRDGRMMVRAADLPAIRETIVQAVAERRRRRIQASRDGFRRWLEQVRAA
jgi:hypothetical protein